MKREPVQEHMPLVQLRTPGVSTNAVDARIEHVESDYCPEAATWHHWGVASSVNRDCYACDEHVHWLNRYYGAEDQA